MALASQIAKLLILPALHDDTVLFTDAEGGKFQIALCSAVQ